MKKRSIFSVLLLVLLAVGLILGSCDNGSTSSDDAVKGNRTYSGKAGNTYYTLKVSNEARAAGEYTPASGDAYTLTITEGSSTKTSQGTVSSARIEGGNIVLTLKPSNSSQTFRVTAPENSTTISAITGTIVTTDGTEETPPSVIYPGEQPSTGGGGGSSGGGGGGGNDPVDPPPTPVPTTADMYEITKLTQVVGAITPVSITPATSGVGAVTKIYYDNGTDPKTETIPTDPPLVAGDTLTVTFDVAAGTGYTAATNLSAGTLTIVATAPAWEDPTKDDYTVTPGSPVYNGEAKGVTSIAPKNDEGAVTRIYYNGSETKPINAGEYTVTFDTAEKAPYRLAKGLDGGKLTIAKGTPTAADFDFGNLTQVEGNLAAVTITPKAGKSAGALTILYGGNPKPATAAVTDTPIAITFNVADEGTGKNWGPATGLSAGDLTITAAPVDPDETNFNVPANMTNVYNGQAQPVTITSKIGGTVKVKYDGSETAPTNVKAGGYTVTVDITGAAGYNDKTGIEVGTYTITQVTVDSTNMDDFYTITMPANDEVVANAASSPVTVVPKATLTGIGAASFMYILTPITTGTEGSPGAWPTTTAVGDEIEVTFRVANATNTASTDYITAGTLTVIADE